MRRLLEMQHTAERSQQRCLAQTRHAFQQNVPSGQQADQHAIYHVLLPNNDLTDFLTDLIEVPGGELKWGLRTHGLILTVTTCGC